MMRRLSLVLALALTAWAIALAAFGGLDATILGVKVTSNEPLRPLSLAAAAFVVFAWLHGASRVHARVRWAAQFVQPSIAAPLLAAVVAAVASAYSTTAAAASDSYGYVSEADLFLARDARIEQPWTLDAPWPLHHDAFAPLAYRAIPDDPQGTIVPTYSPGLPLLMAAAKIVGGQEGLFAVVPIAAGFLVLATFGIGRRLGMPRAGLIAAWLVATSPALLALGVRPMSDVPVSAAWAAAFWCALGEGVAAAAGAGLCTGLAILIRPNLAVGAIAIVLWYAIRPGAARARRLSQVLVFGISAAPGVAAVALLYRYLYGSATTSGYGRIDQQFVLAHFGINLRHYLTWTVQTQTIGAVAGLAAVLVPLRRVWGGDAARRFAIAAAVFTALVWTEYCVYMVFDDWLYLRFLLPTWPFLMFGAGAVAMRVVARGRAWPALAAIGAVLWMGIFGWRVSAQRDTFRVWRDERRFVTVAQLVRERTPPTAVVFSMLHSGTVRYYGGRRTARYDFVDPDWMDRAVAWVESHGGHAYALLETWELEGFRKQFAGQAVLRALETPRLVYEGTTTVQLYDLSSLPAPAARPEVFVERFVDARRSAPPAASQ